MSRGTGMAWQRTTPRPDRSSWAWQQARRAALARDGYQCQALVQGKPCHTPTNEVDHIDQSNNHSQNNLISLCSEHHRIKTQKESAAARWRYREKRKPESHPGYKT